MAAVHLGREVLPTWLRESGLIDFPAPLPNACYPSPSFPSSPGATLAPTRPTHRRCFRRYVKEWCGAAQSSPCGGEGRPLRILSGVTHMRTRAGRVGRAGMAAGRDLAGPGARVASLAAPFPLVPCRCMNDSSPYLSPHLFQHPSFLSHVLPTRTQPGVLALYNKSLAHPSGCPTACLSASLSSALCPSRSASLSSLLLLSLRFCCHL